MMSFGYRELLAVASVGLGGTMATKSIKRENIKCLAPLPPFCFRPPKADRQKSKTEKFSFPF